LGATVIRGLKPTAKFICRYAAKMRLQPTTNGPRPRVFILRAEFIRRYATGTNWGDVIRGLKPTAKISRRYATREDFNPAVS
jgi:hypothetical protein